MHNRSSGPKAIAWATKRALLTMLWWVRVAPFGDPVVPEVNWMLIASCGDRASLMASRLTRLAPRPRSITWSKE